MKRAIWGLTLCVGMLGFGHAGRAQAQPADELDVVVGTGKVCASIDASRLARPEVKNAYDRLCAPVVRDRVAALVARRVPPSAVEPQLCSDIQLLVDANTDTAAMSALQTTCHLRAATAGVNPADAVLVNVVTGLADHIAAIARQDIEDYVMKNLTSTFCKDDKANPLALKSLFPATCRLFDTTVTPIDALTLTGVKAAFLADGKGLRNTLPPKLADVVASYLKAHPELQPIAAAAGVSAAVGATIYEIFVAKVSPADLFATARTWVAANYPAPVGGAPPKLVCSLVTDKKNPECIALLGMTLAGVVYDAYKKGEDLVGSAPRLIDQAVTQFCAEHTSPAKADTSCVIDPRYYERWHAPIVRLYDALYALFDESSTLAKDPAAKNTAVGGKSVTKAEFPALGGDIRETIAAFLALCDDSSKAYGDASSLLLSVIDLALAAAQENIAGTRTPLLQILDNAIVVAKIGNKLDSAAKAAVNFVAALAAADSSTEAKAVIDAVTAPAGTYKEKYGRDKQYLAIGAVIGPMILQQYRRPVGGGGTSTTAATRVAAPVGFEWMPFSGSWVNLGITGTVIDPLAMAASDTKGNTPDTNLGAVLDFGGYLRLGLFKSPISIVAGGSWRPGLRTPSDCTADCYKGTYELFAGIVADVPLLVLH